MILILLGCFDCVFTHVCCWLIMPMLVSIPLSFPFPLSSRETQGFEVHYCVVGGWKFSCWILNTEFFSCFCRVSYYNAWFDWLLNLANFWNWSNFACLIWGFHPTDWLSLCLCVLGVISIFGNLVCVGFLSFGLSSFISSFGFSGWSSAFRRVKKSYLLSKFLLFWVRALSSGKADRLLGFIRVNWTWLWWFTYFNGFSETCSLCAWPFKLNIKRSKRDTSVWNWLFHGGVLKFNQFVRKRAQNL